jgi:hypothetical protein
MWKIGQTKMQRRNHGPRCVSLLVWCKGGCQHQAHADLQALVESGRGDVPLTQLRQRPDRFRGDVAGQPAAVAGTVSGARRRTPAKGVQRRPSASGRSAALGWVVRHDTNMRRIATLAASHAIAAPGHASKAATSVAGAAAVSFRPKRGVATMTTRSAPRRHWFSYGTDPLPTGPEALDEPFTAFPSWFLRIECDRCGKDRMANERHAPWWDRTLRWRRERT